MKTKQHAFYYGYIAVLCFSILYKIVSKTIQKTNFPMWDRIVVAATVSTCFFCIADILHTKADIVEYENIRFNLLLERSNALMKRMQRMLQTELDNTDEGVDKPNKELLFANFEEAMEPEKSLVATKKKISWTFLLNTCGFFAFLMIIVFGKIYSTLSTVQDILTLLAFIIVLCGTIYKEQKVQTINEEMRKRIEDQKRLMVATSVIEIYQEGKKKKKG